MSEENKNEEFEKNENIPQEEAAEETSPAQAAQEDSQEVVEAAQTEAQAEAQTEQESVEAQDNTSAETVSDENTAAQEDFENSSAAEINNEVSPKKSKIKTICAVAGAVVVVAAIVLVGVFKGPEWFNKYNRMGYVDTSGRTIGEVADAAGMDLKDFLAEYQLPEDMPANTTESAAFYTIPVSVMAQMYGWDFDEMKTAYQWGDEVTEDMTWGEAEGLTKLGVMVGEENLESFKQEYGLGDDITADTLWKEVRTIYDTKTKEMNEATEAPTEEPAEETEAPAEVSAAPAADAAAADAASTDTAAQ